MTVYEGNGEEFRPRPTLLSLASVSFFFLLLNLGWTSVLASISEEALSRFAGASGSAFFYAPFAGRYLTFFDNASILRIYLYADAVIAGVSLLASATLIFFWPGERSLASRLYVNLLAAAFAIWGALPRAFEPQTWKHFENAFWTSDKEGIAIAAGIGLAAVILIVIAERKTFVILANLFDVDTPGRRLVLWLARVPAPLLVGGLLCYGNGFRSGAWAAGVAAFVTLFETLSHSPAAKFENIRSPYMREAAAAAPLVAIPLIAAQLWLFGFPPFPLPPRVLKVTSLSEIQRISIGEAELAAPMSHVEAEATAKPKEEKKIDIRWSREKKTTKPHRAK